MLLIECEKCYKGFYPKDEDIQPFIITSGSRPSIRKEEKKIECPYCGWRQEKQNLVFPI